MSILAGPPLWGSSGELAPNLFPLSLRITDIRLDGNLLDVRMESGVFATPIALRLGVHSELSFDILGADLGRPYFVGKPGFWRNVPPRCEGLSRGKWGLLVLRPGGAGEERILSL